MLKKMRPFIRKLAKIFAVLGGIFIILCIVAYFFLADMLGLNTRIPSIIAEKTGLECQVGEVHVILLPQPGILLNDVIFLPPGSDYEMLSSIAPETQPEANQAPAASQVEEAGSLNSTSFSSSITADLPLTNATPSNATNATAHNQEADGIFTPTPQIKATSLQIKNLAVYLDIPLLLSGKVEAVGLGVSGLALYVNSLNDLSETIRHIIPQKPAHTEKANQQVIVLEDSDSQTIAWLWEILKAVRLSDTGVYVLNEEHLYEPLFTNLELNDFLGKLNLSFVAHGEVDNEPYAMNFQVEISRFQSDYDNVSFNLEASADDGRRFSPKVTSQVYFDQKNSLVHFNNFLARTGKTSLSSDIILNLNPEEEELAWQAKGPAVIANFDLPRWVPPLLNMSPETQTILSQIEGELEMEFKQDGLFLNDIRVSAGESQWNGEGSITGFLVDDPKVYFSLKADKLPLEAIFPGLADPDLPPRFTGEAPSFNQPYFLSGEIGNAPKVELILEAETLLFRNLEVGGFKAVMHNSPLDVRWDITAGDLAGGEVSSVIFDNDDYTIDVSGNLNNVQIGPILTGMGWDLPIYGLGGADFSLKGKTGSLEDFLQSMNLEFKGRAKDVLFASIQAPSKPKEREFNRFEQLDFNVKFEGLTTEGKALAALIQLSAQLEGKQQKDTVKLQAKGPMEFDDDNLMQINALDLSGQISSDLAFMGFDGKAQSSEFKGSLKCSQKNSNFELDLNGFNLAGLTGSTQISGKNLGSNAEISGKAQVKTKSLRQFLNKFGNNVAFVPDPLLGEAGGQANFVLNEKAGGMWQAHLSAISAQIDHMNFKAEAWHGPGAETKINGSVDELDLDAYWPSTEKNTPKEPAKPWNVSSWLASGLDITFTTPKLIYLRVPAENVTLKLTTGKGKLLAQVKGSMSDGPLTAELKGHDDAGRLNTSFSLRLEKASLEKITEARSGEVKVSGSLEVSLDIKGTAGSMDDIPNAFDGQWAFNIGKGYFVRSQTQGPAGHRNESDNPVLSNFDFVKGAAEMKAGVLHTGDLLMDGPSTHMVGHGMVNLVTEEINITMDMNLGGVAFPVTIAGDLSDPEISLRGGKFVTRNITNIGGGLIDLIGGVITLPIKVIEMGTE